jgi:type II secretion system protein C
VSRQSKLLWIINIIIISAVILCAIHLISMLGSTRISHGVPALKTEPASTGIDLKFADRLFAANSGAEKASNTTSDPRSWVSRHFGIELKGTAGDQMAIVRDLVSNQEKLVKKGDAVQNGTVVGIERNRLILESGDLREELVLPTDQSASEIPASAASSSSPSHIQRAELKTLLGDVNSLSGEITLQPVRGAAGGLTGYKITSIKPQGVLAKIGLRKMDLLTSVNGQKIQTPEDVYRVLEEASNQDQLTLDIRRNQSDVQMVFKLD